MNRCPDDAVLQQFIAGVQPPGEAEAVESHLDGCERCRRMLDVLAGVTSVGAVLVQAVARPRVESSSLMMAIERLQLEATSLFDTPSSAGSDRTLTTLLPNLTPTSREGFLGKLGGIEIRRVIGRGGMGVVFEGLDPELNRPVAVKVLSPHLLADDEARERFHREAQAAAALAHEHVVAIHAIDRTADGMPYLVLQYVAGESLADRLWRDKRLPPDEVARIGAEIARGLAAAHAQGLVHRDIKPANVLLERGTGRVLVTDFGLAKVVGGETITGIGVLAGTPAFMSPEQAAGEDVDSRSDLFSLGALLYTAASGRLPFSGDSPYVVLNRIRTDPPKPLADLDPTLPVWLRAVIHRLLEKDPARRIQTATEVAELLERQAFVTTVRTGSWWRWVVFGAMATLAVAAGMFAVAHFSTPSAPATNPGLRASEVEIVGRDERWSKLSDAVQAAADGDTLIVHGDGPYPSSKIDVRGKKLTIRAAEGSRPLFVPDGTTRSVQWLTSDKELTLDGIDVDWPGGETPAEFALLSGEEGVVYCRGGLTVRRCRIVSGTRMGCVAGDGPIVIDACHLITDKDGGAGVMWKATAALTVEGTVLEGRNGVVIGVGPNSKAATVAFSDCTFRTDSAVMIVLTRQGTGGPLPMTVRRCVLDTDNVTTQYHHPPYPVGGRPTAGEMKTMARKVLNWTESENVYRRKASYLTAWARGRPQSPGDIKTVADWLEYWQQPDVRSIEGDLRFAPRPDGAKNGPPRLEAVEQPSGVVPAWANGR